MTASWESLNPGRRPRRIRGEEIPIPNGLSWREAQKRAREADAAARAYTNAMRNGDVDGDVGPEVRLGSLRISADGCFAFALFLPMVFLVQFATLGAAMIAGLTPLYLFVRRERLQRALLPRLFLFAFPLVALASVVWSETPNETLRYALELGVTVTAALLLASARDQPSVLKGIALAFLIYVADAVAVGGSVKVGSMGGAAFSGLTDSKNLMADIASTGLIVSLAVLFQSVRERKWIWVAVFAVGVLLDIYCVVAARSAGAMLGLAVGLAPLFVLSPLIHAGKAVRGWLAGTVALVMLTIAVNFRAIAEWMINLSAALFDKDATLTGRTYLWYRAADLIREKPLLGRGYFSFWLQGNIDAEGLWRYAGIESRSGFNFHNTLVDLLVTVGWIGAGVLIVLVLIGGLALIRRYVNRPSLPLVFWISILLYELSRTPIETLGIQPFYYTTTLVFAALGIALGKSSRVRAIAHQPIRSAVPVQVWSVDYAQAGWANPRLTPPRGSLRLLKTDEPAK